MSNKFNLIELKSNGEKKYFIEGYISTTDPDFANDVIDEEGQKATFRELNSADITMDLDHDEWRDPVTGEVYDGKKNKLPIAKVIEKRLDKLGTWVKAELNKYHPNFEDVILPSIKEGYLHSFSVAYNPIKSYTTKIKDVVHRVIRDLKLANIAITGNPVNKNATFNIALKSMDKKMVEEKQFKELQDQFAELKSSTENLVEEKKTLSQEVTELKSKLESLELKAKDYENKKAKESDDEDEDKNKAEMKSLTELKSLKETLESQNKELADLKSIVEKVRETPATSAGSKQTNSSNEIAEINFKSLLGGTQ